jgi:hypothetical protein
MAPLALPHRPPSAVPLQRPSSTALTMRGLFSCRWFSCPWFAVARIFPAALIDALSAICVIGPPGDGDASSRDSPTPINSSHAHPPLFVTLPVSRLEDMSGRRGGMALCRSSTHAADGQPKSSPAHPDLVESRPRELLLGDAPLDMSFEAGMPRYSRRLAAHPLLPARPLSSPCAAAAAATMPVLWEAASPPRSYMPRGRVQLVPAPGCDWQNHSYLGNLP